MAEQQSVARRQSSSKRAKQKDTDREQSGNGGLATDVQELADYLVDRIKPGLNRGSIPLLARSIAKEIAHQDYRNGGANGGGAKDEAEDEPADEVEDEPTDEVEDEVADDVEDEDEDEDEPSAEADDDADEDVEADDEPEEDDDRPSAGLETRLRDLQDELGDEWILYYAVQGDDAWLTAEKEDASQRIEASSADVLARAVKVLNEGGRPKRD